MSRTKALFWIKLARHYSHGQLKIFPEKVVIEPDPEHKKLEPWISKRKIEAEAKLNSGFVSP